MKLPPACTSELRSRDGGLILESITVVCLTELKNLARGFPRRAAILKFCNTTAASTSISARSKRLDSNQDSAHDAYYNEARARAQREMLAAARASEGEKQGNELLVMGLSRLLLLL